MVKDVFALTVKVGDVVMWPKPFCRKLSLNSVFLLLQSYFDSEELLVHGVDLGTD